MHILVADDEPFVRDILEMSLRQAGHTVQMCDGGKAAQAAFAEQKFDLLFTDLKMPDLDGLALAKWVKARAPSQIVVLMTGLGQQGGLPPNIDYVLEKPIRMKTLDELLARIGGLCHPAL